MPGRDCSATHVSTLVGMPLGPVDRRMVVRFRETGDQPEMIVLQFDDRYHHWGALMLRSLALHEPRKRVLADVGNLSPEQVEEISRAHPKVTVRADTCPETSPAQMAIRKCFVLQWAMDEHPREPWYGIFDADFLVRRPLHHLWALM